ncbi:hypothetical protein AB0M20_31285 [Actinoplanes sp. NPDC051633]|uniref:hypothetical protein n=1 Tax=Actinoplanes sp. NPDC051633 TaxID=3155670 RepID=UPI00343FED15
MNTPTLCPACLCELPDDYPFDHIAIDRALTDEPRLFARMPRAERIETVLTGLRRNLSMSTIAARLRCNVDRLRALLPADHPESAVQRRAAAAAERRALETAVASLWRQHLPDTEISMRLDRSVYKIADVRRALGLPTHPTTRRWATPGGPR